MKKALLAIALLLALGAMPAQAGPIGGVEWNGGVFTVELLSYGGGLYNFVYTADLDDFTGGGHTDYLWGINFKPSSGDVTGYSLSSEDAAGVWTPSLDANLSAGGCSGGGNDFFCASTPIPGQPTGTGGEFHWYFTLTIAGVSDPDSLVFGAPIRAVFGEYNPANARWQNSLMSETTTQVPEPGTLSLLGLGLVALAAGLRRRK
jgi:hypothetical protein